MFTQTVLGLIRTISTKISFKSKILSGHYSGDELATRYWNNFIRFNSKSPKKNPISWKNVTMEVTDVSMYLRNGKFTEKLLLF